MPVSAPAQPAAAASTRTPLIVEGTGNFVGTPAPAAQARTAPVDGFELNFTNTEVADVVASVIGDALGLPYLVDPNVKGAMTLQAARPLARDEVLPSLEAALSVQGAALIEVNGVYQVVPSKDAPRRIAGLRGIGKTAAGFAIQIVPVRYVSVTDIEKALRPMAPDGGIVRIDEARNLLLIAGTARELALMQEVINTFDVDWLAGMSFGLYPVEYVDAQTLANELGAVFSGSNNPMTNMVKLVPLTRLNSLMVITRELSYLKQVEDWIRRLDIGVATPGRRIYVYDVQNGKVDDLANSLNKILSLATDQSDTTAARPRTSSRGSSGSLFSDGENSSRSRIPSSAVEPPAANPERAPARTSDDSSPGALKIVPNVENNALLIYATPSEFSVIETALKRLDVTPIQILIEASLAEVTLNDNLRFGLQWSYESGDGPVVLSEASNGGISQAFPGFSYLYTGAKDIRAVLNAIESITNVKVISSPKLMVLNNREAELQIGDQVPITVQSSVSTGDGAAPIVNSVELHDTGVIMRITPRANKSGLVLLDIAQEVSDVVPTSTSNIDSPTIQQRRISSSIAVRDGETIALGGLIRENSTRTRSGVPYLRRIPLLGDIFGSRNNDDRRTELIVLITPRVVRSQREAEDAMDELREQFRGLHDTLPKWTSSQRSSATSGGTPSATTPPQPTP
jgi:general secretion pathway protein D